jgi:hypothetical protein
MAHLNAGRSQAKQVVSFNEASVFREGIILGIGGRVGLTAINTGGGAAATWLRSAQTGLTMPVSWSRLEIAVRN